MDDPKKEKDRMNFYGGWSDIFLDKKYEKLVSDAPTEEMWIALDKLKESLGKENLNRMLQAFICSSSFFERWKRWWNKKFNYS